LVGFHLALMLGLGTVFASPAMQTEPQQATTTAFIGATVFTATGATPLPDAVVLVNGDRIAAVGPRDQMAIPPQASVIDVTGKWIIPGLIDAHVHFFQSGGLYTRPDVIDLRRIRPYAEEIAALRRDLPATLARYIASGVTSVIDMAGPDWIFDLRSREYTRGVAPRVLLTGPALAPQLPPGLDGEHAPGIVVRTPAQAREAVKRLLVARPDILKIWFVPKPDMDLERELAWVRVAVEDAHAHDLRVAAHATQLELARRMVAAGIDILVHSIDDRPIDRELLAQMRDRGTLYITTLDVMEGYHEVLGRQVRLTGIERANADPRVIASFDDLARLFPGYRPRHSLPDNHVVFENLVRVQRVGITVAAGSDAGNIGTLHGPALHRELELMVEAGLSPAETLIAATRGGADVMGHRNDLGTLEPGKLADLVILDANPLTQIQNTRRIAWIVKGGRLYKSAEILADLPRTASSPSGE
jgi:imidazolonepropionase-like amidohydrolase